MIRAPICAVVGHVDHGKTTLLDALRGTATAAGEAGAITQAIGASIIPIQNIQDKAAHLLKGQEITLPGLLFIDTPGHAAFTGMRQRGGSLADIAVLIVDINEGFKPQTREAIEILKSHKTPFVIAANKIDLAQGYRKQHEHIIPDLNAQAPKTQEYVETKTYELIGTLSEMGIMGERFDRLESFEKQVAVIPISAQHGQGIDALLAIIVGLAQRYLEDNLDATPDGPAKGTILEVSEVQGLGKTLDVIIYDGKLDVGDTIVIGTLNEPIVTKVRALLEPDIMADIRDRKTKFMNIQTCVAATGVKIAAPDLDGALAGMPFVEESGDVAELKEQISNMLGSLQIDTDDEGVIIKADNIGSLEAIIRLLRENDIPIRASGVGPVSKKDLVQASSNEKEFAVILAFNLADVKENIPENVHVISANIIYKLIDEYTAYRNSIIQEQTNAELAGLARPAKVRLLPGCIFRQSGPLVCGVEVDAGTLRVNRPLVKANEPSNQVGYVKDIQEKKTSMKEVGAGAQVAISIPGAIGDRHVKEGDILWQPVPEEDFRALKKHAKLLDVKEKDLLKEWAELMREKEPMWGV